MENPFGVRIIETTPSPPPSATPTTALDAFRNAAPASHVKQQSTAQRTTALTKTPHAQSQNTAHSHQPSSSANGPAQRTFARIPDIILPPRHRRRALPRDTLLGVTKPAIRRLARRGGVLRISEGVYHETRTVLRERLVTMLQRIVLVLEASKRQTMTAMDVVFVLRGMGKTLYGFDG